MLIIAAFALLTASLVVLFVLARKTRAFWAAAVLVACSAILFAVYARAMDRGAKKLSGEIATRDSLIHDYCSSLAESLLADVARYRAVTKNDPLSTEATRLEVRYQDVRSERISFARLCLATGTEDVEWLECLPPGLGETTIAQIERAADAIKQHRRCPRVVRQATPGRDNAP